MGLPEIMLNGIPAANEQLVCLESAAQNLLDETAPQLTKEYNFVNASEAFLCISSIESREEEQCEVTISVGQDMKNAGETTKFAMNFDGNDMFDDDDASPRELDDALKIIDELLEECEFTETDMLLINYLRIWIEKIKAHDSFDKVELLNPEDPYVRVCEIIRLRLNELCDEAVEVKNWGLPLEEGQVLYLQSNVLVGEDPYIDEEVEQAFPRIQIKFEDKKSGNVYIYTRGQTGKARLISRLLHDYYKIQDEDVADPQHEKVAELWKEMDDEAPGKTDVEYLLGKINVAASFEGANFLN